MKTCSKGHPLRINNGFQKTITFGLADNVDGDIKKTFCFRCFIDFIAENLEEVEVDPIDLHLVDEQFPPLVVDADKMSVAI